MAKKKRMSRRELKARIKLGLAAILSVFGIKVATNLIDAPKEEPVKIESEEKSFKDKYVVSEEELSQYKPAYSEKSDIEKAVEQLKSKADIEAFLKNMYIEQYEKITGDETLTTADIKFDFNNWQDYVFVNQETGEIVTHGQNPDITKSKLEGNYTTKENVNVLKVYNNNGQVIDAVTMKNIEGQYVAVQVNVADELNNYNSVLANSNDENLANIINKGLQYAEKIEDKTQQASAKQQFIQELEEADKGNIEKTDEAFEIDD